jgi:hypothetical protein
MDFAIGTSHDGTLIFRSFPHNSFKFGMTALGQSRHFDGASLTCGLPRWVDVLGAGVGGSKGRRPESCAAGFSYGPAGYLYLALRYQTFQHLALARAPAH